MKTVLKGIMTEYIDKDYELIKACQADCRDAFEQLVLIHAESVHNFIYSTLGDPYIVEDIAQETFLRVLKNIKSYNFNAPFRSWLYRIVVNLCKDHLRRKKIRNIFAYFYNNYNSKDREYTDFSQNPVIDLEQQELGRIIQKAIDNLTPSLRCVLQLRDIEDFTYEEIAHILNWKIGTVKSRLYRARKDLAKLLISCKEDL